MDNQNYWEALVFLVTALGFIMLLMLLLGILNVFYNLHSQVRTELRTRDNFVPGQPFPKSEILENGNPGTRPSGVELPGLLQNVSVIHRELEPLLKQNSLYSKETDRTSFRRLIDIEKALANTDDKEVENNHKHNDQEDTSDDGGSDSESDRDYACDAAMHQKGEDICEVTIDDEDGGEDISEDISGQEDEEESSDGGSRDYAAVCV